MSEPLYLKYRPQKLSELVGQEVIARTLTNAIKINKVSHAYFFTGPRGCGKTSTARIIAKSLNCKNGPTLDPCGVCENCIEIAQGISPDVTEMDAASHRSVEDAAQVIERSHLAPQTAQHKIYILDEVHMLSKEAFNALLKTIEEPPPNVIFILATTEEHKVPSTIVSRCQKFSFRPIDSQPLIERLKSISEKENILLTEGCYKLIAKQSRGGLRDALSLLDQISVLASPGETVNEKLILDLFGSISEEALNQLLDLMCQRNYAEALSIVDSFLKDGIDPLQLIRNLIEFAVDKLEANLEKTNLVNKTEKSNSVIASADIHRLAEIIDGLNKSEYSLRNASQPTLRLKSLILSICVLSSSDDSLQEQNANPQPANQDLSQLMKRLEFLENQIKTLQKRESQSIENHQSNRQSGIESNHPSSFSQSSSGQSPKISSTQKPSQEAQTQFQEKNNFEVGQSSTVQSSKVISEEGNSQQSQSHSKASASQTAPRSQAQSGLINILLANLTNNPIKALIPISKVFVISETSNSAVLGVPQKTFYDKLNDSKKIKIIEDTLSEALSKNYAIKIELAEGAVLPQASNHQESTHSSNYQESRSHTRNNTQNNTQSSTKQTEVINSLDGNQPNSQYEEDENLDISEVSSRTLRRDSNPSSESESSENLSNNNLPNNSLTEKKNSTLTINRLNEEVDVSITGKTNQYNPAITDSISQSKSNEILDMAKHILGARIIKKN
jgi:DNA polymerase III subunit gamma/tau